MDEQTALTETPPARSAPVSWYVLPAVILLVLAGAFLAYRAWTSREATSTPAVSEFIAAPELEERYGLRVRLVGVTAEGGLVDFRLKIVDADKAKQLLEDPARTPGLWIEDSGTTLNAPQEMRENLKLEDGGIVFFLLPNVGNAVKPGTPVTVTFGDLSLEPMPAQ